MDREPDIRAAVQFAARNAQPDCDALHVTGTDLDGRSAEIDLQAGGAEATILTNDLTHDYVHENSAYSS